MRTVYITEGVKSCVSDASHIGCYTQRYHIETLAGQLSLLEPRWTQLHIVSKTC